MRWSAYADLPAFHKINARAAGFDADIATAAQKSFRLATHDFDTHRAVDADGFPVDDAYRISKRFIGACGGNQSSTKNCQASRREYGEAPVRVRIGRGRHSMKLPEARAESLAYTIRRVIYSRLER